MNSIKDTFVCVWHKIVSIGNRKRSVDEDSVIRKKRNNMNVSATETRNFMLRDPILDWLNLYGEFFGYVKDKDINESNYANFLLERGVQFENIVIEDLKKRIGNCQFVDVKEKYQSFCPEGAKYTKKLMKSGVEIIYQGFLLNEEMQIYGIPDLLIRSDILSLLFDLPELEIENPVGKYVWTYFVLDIKLSSIYLGKNGNILNSGNLRPYKAQLFIYNKILENIFYGESDFEAPFKNPYAFLMGRRLVTFDKESRNGLLNLGIIDFNKESMGKTVKEAVEWIIEVRQDGHRWKIEMPNCPELKPNMKNQSDFPWTNAKKLIAERQNDLTRYWKISSKMRDEIGKIENVESYLYENVVGDSQRQIMVKMNNINEGDEEIHYELNLEKTEKISKVVHTQKFKFFVDFEFINGSDITFDHNTRTHLYMIGVGYFMNNRWEFQVFIPKTLNDRDEKQNIYRWLNFMKTVAQINGYQEYILFHWSNAEPCLFNRLKEYFLIRANLEWIDLLGIYRDIQFICKGMYNFSLKSVAKSMNSMGLIKTVWDQGVSDGLGAQLILINGLKMTNVLNDIPNMTSIINYNEIDCRVLYEMEDYLNKLLTSVRL